MKKEKEDFKNRLVEILKERRQTWWAENLKQSQSAVGKWLQNSFPRSDKLLTILRLSDVSANWMLFDIGPKRLSDLDENETERRQDQGREVQIQLLKMARENEKLKEKIEELERENSQKTIDWLFKKVDKKDADDGEKKKVFKYNIFPVLALMRQINDISFKVLEGYAKENIDDKKYREISDYIKRNNQKNTLGLKKMLVELDEVIK
jgi:hypothetical protein